MRVIKTNPLKGEYFKESTVEKKNIDANTEGGIVNVFDDVRYQEIFGFGGALTEAAAYNYSLMDEKTKAEFMKAYFDKEKGIAYNFGRCHINSCDFSLDIYTNVDEGDKTLESFSIERDKKYIIPFVKDAMKYSGGELVLFASPWSPPAYMKDNNSMLHGGSLLGEYKELWAKYYAKYIKAYAAEGIKISAISVQNEPKAKQTWESCYYAPEDERDFIEKYLAPVLDSEGLGDIKIIIWDHNKERIYDRAKTILSSKAVNDRVWAVGHHWYTGDHFDGLRLVQEQLHKPNICTEFCSSLAMTKDDLLGLAERYGKEICGNMNHYCIGICDWNIMLDETGGPYHNRGKAGTDAVEMVYVDGNAGCYAPIMYHAAENRMELTPMYYYIGHFSKYIKRGAKRIATTKYTDDLCVCAFINPDGERVVIIMNTSDTELPAIIRINGECTKIMIEPHSIATVLF